MTSPPAPVRAILFDLGRVVIDIDFERALSAWQRHSRLPPEQLRALFRHDEPYERHETGSLSAESYFEHLRELLALECDGAQVALGWNSIFLGEIEETVHMLDAIRDKVPCYAISNTNAAHVDEMNRGFPALLPRFRKVFTSHEIGHRKPHAEAFRHVLREIGVPAPEVLLFDDLPENIEGARRCGLQATLVRSPQDVRDTLLRIGLLQAGV
jgi:putative hydrolase of the HAD superfamily